VQAVTLKRSAFDSTQLRNSCNPLLSRSIDISLKSVLSFSFCEVRASIVRSSRHGAVAGAVCFRCFCSLEFRNPSGESSHPSRRLRNARFVELQRFVSWSAAQTPCRYVGLGFSLTLELIPHVTSLSNFDSGDLLRENKSILIFSIAGLVIIDLLLICFITGD